ncbi:transposase [Allobaculum mucilyticum]|nr:transposase [Allobaculum mucilyticum]UNT95531.1 transposase [Allobaculum mucilyticum]
MVKRVELRELLLSISDDLTEACEMRNTLSEFFRNGTKADAADRLQVILADLNRSQVKELNAFGQTVVNWFREIVNFSRSSRRSTSLTRRTEKLEERITG